ncbi:hypothetical protein [Streptomyces sp. NBC_00829]|uniref:hypothetical protein n=1 Tax=Streptomyces sp. NBC_00829 TaxID=2903679 RepID=UPI002F907A9F|nr:hypothetical protein OG293_39955 [Streptomyces sp. NBC_00829]
MLSFSAALTATVAVPVDVMFVISSTTPTGKQREKVYFLNRNTVQPGQPLLLAKPHKLRSTATTKITPGPYTVAIQVNGRRFPPLCSSRSCKRAAGLRARHDFCPLSNG